MRMKGQTHLFCVMPCLVSKKDVVREVSELQGTVTIWACSCLVIRSLLLLLVKSSKLLDKNFPLDSHSSPFQYLGLNSIDELLPMPPALASSFLHEPLLLQLLHLISRSRQMERIPTFVPN